jgi:hypothetical protein
MSVMLVIATPLIKVVANMNPTQRTPCTPKYNIDVPYRPGGLPGLSDTLCKPGRCGFL